MNYNNNLYNKNCERWLTCLQLTIQLKIFDIFKIRKKHITNYPIMIPKDFVKSNQIKSEQKL